MPIAPSQHQRRRGILARWGTTAVAAGAFALALAPAQAGAAFPGANGRIVFSSNRATAYGATDFELYSMGANGSGLRRLTYNSFLPPGTPVEGEEGEECSKGGDKGGGESGGAGEAAAPEAGGTEEGAQQIPIEDIQPAVSPDGKQIAFVSNRAGEGGAYSEIWVMSIDGADPHQLTASTQVKSGPKEAYEPAWSPDGRQIVFRRGEGAKADLWIADLATGRLTKLTTSYEKGPAGYDGAPAWSPDGAKIAFVKGFGRAADIWVYDLYGPHQGESRPVIHAINVAENGPSFSPDGAQIVYARGDEAAGAGIWVANADGSGQHSLIQPQPDAEGKAYSDMAPRFSPDGRQIAFESSREGIPQTVNTGTDEGECKEGEDETPSGAIGIFTMNADGSGVARLTSPASVNGPQDLSPDWQTIPLPSPQPPPPEVPSQQQLQAPAVEVPVVSHGQKLCVSLHSFTITIHLNKMDRKHMRWVHARINRKRVKVIRRGRVIKVPIDARRAVKGKLTVKVYVMLRHGNHLWAKHTFNACTGNHRDGLAAFRLQRHKRHHGRVSY